MPEGRCAWTRPQHASWALNDHPEQILPGHLGPTGAPGGRRCCAATIMGWRAIQTIHEAAGWRGPRADGCSRLECHPGRRGAARLEVGAAPCHATHARPTAEKKPVRRHRTQRAKARRVGLRRRSLPGPACSDNALKLGKVAKHNPKPPRLRACRCRRRPATPPPLVSASAGL